MNLNDHKLKGGQTLFMSEYLVFTLCEFSTTEVGKGVPGHMIFEKFQTLWT